MQREEFSHGVADPFYREAFHKTAEVIAGLCTELSTETELSTGNGKNELQKEKMEGEKRKRDIPPRPPIESKGKEEGEKKDPPSSARSACVCACVREDTREADAVFDDFWAKYPTGFKVAKKRCRDKVRSRYRAAKDKAQFVNAFLGGLDRWLACQRWSEGIICNPETWINQERWLATPEPSSESDTTKAEAARTARNAEAAEILKQPRG